MYVSYFIDGDGLGHISTCDTTIDLADGTTENCTGPIDEYGALRASESEWIVPGSPFVEHD